MCDITKRNGTECARPGTFHVHIKGYEIWPAPGGPDYPSSYGMPRVNGAFTHDSGLSIVACSSHVTAAVLQLNGYRYARDNGTYGQFRAGGWTLPTVAPYAHIGRVASDN